MKPMDIRTHREKSFEAIILDLRAQIYEYKKWDAARAMVIGHLKQNFGLTDQYQWAYKVIDLLKELEEYHSQKLSTPYE